MGRGRRDKVFLSQEHIPRVEELKREVGAWQTQRNESGAKVIWKFTTKDARVKLKHLYPIFEEEGV